MKRSFSVVCFFVCATWTLGLAQSSTPTAKAPAAPMAAQGSAKDPVTTSLRILLPRSQNNTMGAIEAMPADKFSYKPTPEQITFAHLVAHIANSNNFLCAKVANLPDAKTEEAKDTDPKDKLEAAAKASFEFCAEAIGKMDDSKLGDSIELFGGRQFPRAMAALGLASGWADHYAAAAMYLRLNGIMPPSAQPKK